MRRPTAAVAGTLAGTALLAALKFGAAGANAQETDALADGGAPAAQNQPADPGSAAPAATASASTPGRASRGGAPIRSRTPGAGTKPRPTVTSTRKGTGGGSTGSAGSAGSGLKSGTFAGAASTNRYGTVRVTITVSGGRLTNATATYATAPSRTAQINGRAIPKLKQEALAAQSARIATVSGATYTSSSYRASLQSALTAAGA